MLHTKNARAASPFKRYAVSLARHADDIREAQKLRWLVFAQEFGADLQSPEPGLDIDKFDIHCEHLIVRDRLFNRVVGTYRLLTARAARQAGGYYSEQEFDLGHLVERRPNILEMGRSCVHPESRGGPIVTLLWAGLGEFLAADPHDTLIGCASIPLNDGGHHAASVYTEAARHHLSAPEFRVNPRRPLPLAGLDASRDPSPPPLIRGYLRSGAVICGAPAFDPEFNTADLFMMLQLEQIELRHTRYLKQPLPKVA